MSAAAPGRRSDSIDRTAASSVITAALIGIGALALALRHWRGSDIVSLAAVAAVPWLMLAPVAALTLAAVRRRWLLVAISAAVTLACAASQSAVFTRTPAPSHAQPVVVMTVNMLHFHHNGGAVVAAARRHGVEILMVQELTRIDLADLDRSGIGKLFPHSIRRAEEWTGDGTGLWSTYALASTQPAAEARWHISTAARVPELDRPLRVVGLHASGPVPHTGPWRRDISSVPRLLRTLPSAGPVIVGGDFNATRDSPWFRDVEATGFEDAADQAGGGLVFTWPANRLFPIIGIDHILTRNAVVTSLKRVTVGTSDHYALLATVAVPRRSS